MSIRVKGNLCSFVEGSSGHTLTYRRFAYKSFQPIGSGGRKENLKNMLLTRYSEYCSNKIRDHFLSTTEFTIADYNSLRVGVGIVGCHRSIFTMG